MKKDLIAIWTTLLFVCIPFFGISNQDPPFNLVVKWKDPSDTSFVHMIRTDPEICCDFSISLIKSDSCCTEVYTREGESVGVLYGRISPRIIRQLIPKFFESKYDIDRRRNPPLITEE